MMIAVRAVEHAMEGVSNEARSVRESPVQDVPVHEVLDERPERDTAGDG
jgi:hypothetical protein